MDSISEEELDTLDVGILVQRMDDVLDFPTLGGGGDKIMKLQVVEVYNTAAVQRFTPEFQRRVIYKTFGFLLQLQYTHLSVIVQFIQPTDDLESARQIYAAARKQWFAVSSRVAFEYFMHITYMLGTGEDFDIGRSAIRKYKTWLKEEDNQYTYFAISVARAHEYDQSKRTPEVHANTTLARRILLQSATAIDDDMFHLYNILRMQWQFVLDIADDRKPNGWGGTFDIEGDRKWYELWESGDRDAIVAEIDRMFP